MNYAVGEEFAWADGSPWCHHWPNALDRQARDWLGEVWEMSGKLLNCLQLKHPVQGFSLACSERFLQAHSGFSVEIKLGWLV